MRGYRWQGIQVIAGLLLALVTEVAADAAYKVRVGKSVTQPFAFAPIEIGLEKGIWARHGLELEVSIFAGDAKLQQALVANSVDFGLGSGPSIGFLAKGVPAKAVGVIANEPLSMGLIVGSSSAIRTPGELKGAKIGVSTEGSLTYWLASETPSASWPRKGRAPLPDLQLRHPDLPHLPRLLTMDRPIGLR
jgi:NitT/TauT family transport system substrate-binding protein